MDIPLHWDIERRLGRHFTIPSTVAPILRNIFTTASVCPAPPTSLTLDIWRFTLYWTFAIFGGVFLTAGLWAGSVLIMKTKWAILVPLLYCVCGILVALVTGTIVGRTPWLLRVFERDADVGRVRAGGIV